MINIAFNIDKNYADKVKVVIKSILCNTNEEVTFHIIGYSFRNAPSCIKCYEAPNISDFPFIKEVGEISKAAAYRLFLPDILKELDKVIYLDCDLVVLDNIVNLWNINVDVIAAVLDPMWKSQAALNNLKYYYVNSGVMLLNLQKLRELNYKELLRATQDKKYDLHLPDQDMINIAYGKYMQYLPEKWNVYGQIYKEITVEQARARMNPSIIHWCSVNKPWKKDRNAWRKEEWLRYAGDLAKEIVI